jgi:hypothetical protein
MGVGQVLSMALRGKGGRVLGRVWYNDERKPWGCEHEAFFYSSFSTFQRRGKEVGEVWSSFGQTLSVFLLHGGRAVVTRGPFEPFAALPNHSW